MPPRDEPMICLEAWLLSALMHLGFKNLTPTEFNGRYYVSASRDGHPRRKFHACRQEMRRAIDSGEQAAFVDRMVAA